MTSFLWRGDRDSDHFGRFPSFPRFLARVLGQIFGGAQTPAPFSGRLILAKMGGGRPPFPPENIFSGFFQREFFSFTNIPP